MPLPLPEVAVVYSGLGTVEEQCPFLQVLCCGLRDLKY